MPAIHVLNMMGSGHECYPPHNCIQASPNVFVEGVAAHREGDMWAPHMCGQYIHTGVLAKGSSSVFVNGVGVARIGDKVSCGSVAVQGVTTVFAGG